MDIIVKFKGMDITVREFTAADYEKLLPAAGGKISFIDICFNGDMVDERMLQVATGLDAADLHSTTPSRLRPLVEAVKEANPDFFTGLRSLGAVPAEVRPASSSATRSTPPLPAATATPGTTR